MKPSSRFVLSDEDLNKWKKNVLIYAVPVVLIVLSSAVKEVPADWKYATITIYITNCIIDLLKKYVQGPSR